MSMKRTVLSIGSLVCVGLLAASVVACKDKDGNKAKPKAADAAVAPPTEPVKSPVVKAPSQDELAAWYRDCWSQWNAQAWDKFGPCYDEKAVSELPGTPSTNGRAAIVASAKETRTPWPDLSGELELVLVNGKYIFGVALLRGTHTAPFKLPTMEIPASNKKFGYLFAHLVEVNDQGKVVHEWGFFDTGTLMGQLGVNPNPHRPAIGEGWAEKPTVVAKNDATEKANLDVYMKMIEAYNAHDAKAMGALFADELVWSETGWPVDQDKKALTKNLESMWKGFSDAKLTPGLSFAAGDYVLGVNTLSGTNDGVSKEMGLNKTGKKMELSTLEVDQYKDGKLVKGWLFYDGGQVAMQLGLGAAPPPK
jgi:predicted ester cyclase